MNVLELKLFVNWTECISFVILGFAVLTTALAYRRTLSRVIPAAPTQLWLQDCSIATLAYGAYVCLHKVSVDNEWITNAPLRGAVLTAAALLASIETCREWPRLQRPRLRALAVGMISTGFLIGGGSAVLAWWVVRTLVVLFVRKEKADGRLAIPFVTASKAWVLICGAAYAVAFPLSTGINVGWSTKDELYGWGAYADSSEVVLNPFTHQWVNMSDIPWTANPLLWLSVALFLEGRFGLATASSMLALICGLSFYVHPEGELLHFCPAYHIWLAAMGIILFGSAFEFARARSRAASIAKPRELASETLPVSVEQIPTATHRS